MGLLEIACVTGAQFSASVQEPGYAFTRFTMSAGQWPAERLDTCAIRVRFDDQRPVVLVRSGVGIVFVPITESVGAGAITWSRLAPGDYDIAYVMPLGVPPRVILTLACTAGEPLDLDLRDEAPLPESTEPSEGR